MGYKKDLMEEDLSKTLPSHSSKKLGDRITELWLKELNRAKSKGKKPKIQRVLFKQFWKEILLLSLPVIILELGVRFVKMYF